MFMDFLSLFLFIFQINVFHFLVHLFDLLKPFLQNFVPVILMLLALTLNFVNALTVRYLLLYFLFPLLGLLCLVRKSFER
jgi:hypothetical protein